MINAARYSRHIAETAQNRQLMARIALNALGHAAEFPVDLRQLRNLSPINSVITNAFLDWCVVHGDYRYVLDLPDLQAIARGEPR